MRNWIAYKGNGTLNDFVILKDREGMLDLTPDVVQYLCDRRAGLGGDGVLRAVKAELIPEWTGDPSLWFMDYRNADGSIAEMCGNGLRVFVQFLISQGLIAPAEVEVATRAGLRTATPLGDGRISVSMGEVKIDYPELTVSLSDRRWPADRVNVGNPHAVVFLDFDDDIESLDLTVAPTWNPGRVFPHGTNIEFVEILGERHLKMRVYERGVGETMSCGTGVVAAATSHAARMGLTDGSIAVDVRGGVLEVGLSGEITLTGEAIINGECSIAIPDYL